MALIDGIYIAVTILFVLSLSLIMLYVNEERKRYKERLRDRRDTKDIS